MDENKKLEREMLYKRLMDDKNFLYLFEIIKDLTRQLYSLQDEGKDDPTVIWRVWERIANRIFDECKIYVDEYDLFLSRNNLTRDSSEEVIEKLKKEQGFKNDHASREPFFDLFEFDDEYEFRYPIEDMVKQLVYWDEDIIFEPDRPRTDFAYGEPRYKVKSFEITKKKQ